MRVQRLRRLLPALIATLALTGTGARSQSTRSDETAAQAVSRAVGTTGNRWGQGVITDSISQGTITYFSLDGPQATFDVTVFRKGTARFQAVVRQGPIDVRLGTDGNRTWHSLSNGLRTEAVGRGKSLIETHTVRSVANLMDHQRRGLTIADKGQSARGRVVETQDPEGRRTDYTIDDESSLVTTVEFATGEVPDAFGGTITETERYDYSDFRDVDGTPTPFRIEHWSGGIKIEEFNFTSVRYNTNIDDGQFIP